MTMDTTNQPQARPRQAPQAKVRPAAGPSEHLYVASQWQLMWWRFRKHKMALVSTVILAALYLMGVFSEFFAPYSPTAFDRTLAFAPPQKVHLRDQHGVRSPFVYGIKQARDPKTLEIAYDIDTDRKYPIKLLIHGDSYEIWGLIAGDIHFFGTGDEEGPMLLLGTDRMGRDMLSRIITGARISLSIGLVGVFLSLTLGIMIGGLSGYYGGVVDMLSQRIIEVLRSIPRIPLWMALSAAVPPFWSPVKIYFGITLVLSFVGWTDMARVVRGRFLSLREEDFVMAAKLVGSSEPRIVLRHMVPSFLSYIIASITLAIPGMIIGETALSFLGVGLREPVVSWGVLLKEAQMLSTVAVAPWLLLPGVAVVLSVLTFNFAGDGLRDAADPYAR
jgi:peptide/nickel transport system permease protein